MDSIDHDTEQAVRRFLVLLVPSFSMAGAILYGSRARGVYRPDSDADVAVLLHGGHQRALPTTLAMADIAYDVLLESGINISPLPVWEEQREHPDRHSNPAWLRNIARDAALAALLASGYDVGKTHKGVGFHRRDEHSRTDRSHGACRSRQMGPGDQGRQHQTRLMPLPAATATATASATFTAVQYKRMAVSKCQVRRISMTSNSVAKAGGNAG